MSTVTFSSIPPSDEARLLSQLRAPGSASLCLRFERPKTLMREISRVVRCAMNAGIRIEEIVAEDFAILVGFEREPKLLESQSADGLYVGDVVSASYGVRFQPGCFQQMEHLCRFLFAHRRLRTLSVSLFEFPTGDCVNKDAPLLMPALPSMLGMDKVDSAEEEGAMIGRMIADKIFEQFGRARPAIRGPTTQLELMLGDMFGKGGKQLTDGDVDTLLTNGLAVAKTGGSEVQQAIASSLFKYMTAQQYNELIVVFTSRPLPEALEHLTIRAQLETPQPAFLYALPCLRFLDLSYCGLNDAALAVLGPVIGQRLPRLETLVMARNRVREAALCELLGPELRRVDLSYNPITCAAAATLFDSAALVEVDLQHTYICDGPTCPLPASNRIATLNLSGCGITDAVFAVLGPSLARQTALQTLVLQRNILSGAALGEMVGPALASLDLKYNPLTGRAASSLLAALEGNSVLARIDLRSTFFSSDGFEFERIRHWRASPAVLEMPHCFADDATLWRMMAFVPAGVDVNLERMEAERMQICN